MAQQRPRSRCLSSQQLLLGGDALSLLLQLSRSHLPAACPPLPEHL